MDEIGHPVDEPVYVCPCHNSTFTWRMGKRLAGPAPRGLYRFRVTGVTATAVEIAEVEEDVLIFAYRDAERSLERVALRAILRVMFRFGTCPTLI